MKSFLLRLCLSLIRGKDRKNAFHRRHYWSLHPHSAVENAVARAMSTCSMHRESFLRFKNCNAGRDVVLVASGPTLARYVPVPGAVHIGVNTAVRFGKVPMDYVFIQDAHGRRDLVQEINDYRPNSGCVKFYGIMDERRANDYTVSESDAIAAGALRYRVDLGLAQRMEYDITSFPLATFGTVALPAAAFALWTNPRRLYLVGCDCSSGYFYDGKADDPRLARRHDEMVSGYRALKRFAEKWYPDTEIVSVNPVGLKGMFRDEFQDGRTEAV